MVRLVDKSKVLRISRVPRSILPSSHRAPCCGGLAIDPGTPMSRHASSPLPHNSLAKSGRITVHFLCRRNLVAVGGAGLPSLGPRQRSVVKAVTGWLLHTTRGELIVRILHLQGVIGGRE